VVVALRVLHADRDDVSILDRILDLQGCWYLGEHEPGLLGVANRELVEMEKVYYTENNILFYF
jgi:hypothetical protein